jgi:hypothetical protein
MILEIQVDTFQKYSSNASARKFTQARLFHAPFDSYYPTFISQPLDQGGDLSDGNESSMRDLSSVGHDVQWRRPHIKQRKLCQPRSLLWRHCRFISRPGKGRGHVSGITHLFVHPIDLVAADPCAVLSRYLAVVAAHLLKLLVVGM